MRVTYKSIKYSPAIVAVRYVRKYGEAFRYCEVNAAGRDVLTGTLTADEIPDGVRADVDACGNQYFGWVDWPEGVAPPTEDVVWACQWFLLCENKATTTRPHPILGDVPICERCKA